MKKQNQHEEEEKKRRKESEEKKTAYVKPEDYFKDLEKWKAWDEEGVPTHYVQGIEVSKSSRKKMKKELEKHKKIYAKYNS